MPAADIFINLGGAFLDIIKPMFVDPSLFWYLGPVLLFWLILEVYFSRYKSEELGWNTALGNGLSVFWIITICMKYLFDNKMENFEWAKFIALIIMLLYAVFIIINSFSHRLREHLSFLLASPTATYYLSGVAVLWTYGKLQLTGWVLIDLVLFYGFVILVELILKRIIKGKESDLNFGKEAFSTENQGLGGLGKL
jgi:hypothetical protein